MPLAMQAVMTRHIVVVVAVRHITTRLIVKVAGIVISRTTIISTTGAPTTAPTMATMMMMSMTVMPGTDNVVGFAFVHSAFDGQVFDFYA
tara:strand:- start:213 stop:482 length:270 start_codon:yes stop_codon:yes gene_type:complete